MGDWPLRGEGQRWSDWVDAGQPSASTGITLDAHATPNTEAASWTEIDAAVAVDCDLLLIVVRFVGNNRDWLLDLAVGAASSEQAFLTDFPLSNAASSLVSHIALPVRIKAGERISARIRSTAASAQLILGLIYCDSNRSAALGRATTYGVATADSGGTEVDPGGTANTKGSWAEIASSTANPMKEMIVCFGSQAGNTRATANWVVDIGLGAGGSEQLLVPNLGLRAVTSGPQVPACTPPIPVNIPAGSRLVARAASNINTSVSRLIDVAVVGFD